MLKSKCLISLKLEHYLNSVWGILLAQITVKGLAKGLGSGRIGGCVIGYSTHPVPFGNGLQLLVEFSSALYQWWWE